MERAEEVRKLYMYKKISPKEGYDYFLKEMKKNYPETRLNEKYFVVYMWDSTLYDQMFREQMKALDSMAAGFGKYTLEYIFATVMEEKASGNFLKQYGDDYRNVKMLFGMDDYISGLHNIPGIKKTMPKVIHLDRAGNKKKVLDEKEERMKQRNFYLIMNSKGELLHTNGRMYGVLKDTAFLNKLKGLVPQKEYKILN